METNVFHNIQKKFELSDWSWDKISSNNTKSEQHLNISIIEIYKKNHCMKIQTQSVHFRADEKLLSLIDERLQKLELFFDQIIRATVTLKLENNGKIQDKIVEVQLSVPNEQLIAKVSNKKFEVALDDVIEALRKQLLRYKEKTQKNRK